jgi:nucleoid-associated protein EbfC
MTGPGDLNELFSQMASLQSQLASARAVTATSAVEGGAGQGAVRVRVEGEFDFTAVKIDPALLADGDVAILEDLVLAAVRDAVARLVAAQHAALGNAAQSAIADLLGMAAPTDSPEDASGA